MAMRRSQLEDDNKWFEVYGSGNGQIDREVKILTLFRGNNIVWSARRIRVDSNKILILTDDQQWKQVF
jgi:hypothetical protein